LKHQHFLTAACYSPCVSEETQELEDMTTNKMKQPDAIKQPDWFARITGGIGILFALLGFILSTYTYRWQKKTYLESIEERVLVRPVHRTIHAAGIPTAYDEILVEVVNIGMRPVFVKKVTGKVYGLDVVLFNSELAAGAPENFYTPPPLKKLEPGEGTDYDKRLDGFPGDRSNGTFQVTVSTTTKDFKEQTEVLDVKPSLRPMARN